jgi:putative phosphoribosyl transferase
MTIPFSNRAEAGRLLAPRIAALELVDPIVLALPRGGVPVAEPIARALRAPLDILLVRKIGAPGNPEFAVAAIAEGASDQPVVDQAAFVATGTSEAYLQREADVQRQELARRQTRYRRGRSRLDIAGRTVVLVDDGVATGTSVVAALAALRTHRPARVVLALPVGPSDTLDALERSVDDLVCLHRPSWFRAVGEFYDDFAQVSDEEVVAILDRANAPPRGA